MAILLSKGWFERRKIIFHEKNLEHKRIMHWPNFIFTRTFFLITSYQILKNDPILLNDESFFHEKESLQFYRSQFFEIDSLIAETIIINFSEQNFHEQIAECGKKLFILENWKR